MADVVSKEDYMALAAFRAALCGFLRFAEEGCQEAGITPQQHQVLLAIMGRPDRDWASVGELADALQLKPHATVGLVNRCQAAGLVQRTIGATDRRLVQVALTAKGAEKLERLTQRNLAELKSVANLTVTLEAFSHSHECGESRRDNCTAL